MLFSFLYFRVVENMTKLNYWNFWHHYGGIELVLVLIGVTLNYSAIHRLSLFVDNTFIIILD